MKLTLGTWDRTAVAPSTVAVPAPRGRFEARRMRVGLALAAVLAGAAFLAATDLKTAGRTALTGLGLAANDGKNLRVTIASTVANATAGKFRVRVNYTIDGRITEVNPN